MISITINCASVEELHTTLRQILNQHTFKVDDSGKIEKRTGYQLGEGPQPTRTEVVERLKEAQAEQKKIDAKPTGHKDAVVTEQETAEQPAPGEGKPKRTRRTKAEIEAEAQAKRAPEQPFDTKPAHDSKAAEPVAVQAQVVDDGKVTKETVQTALQAVNINVGLHKAREILQGFGVNRISEIKEDQFKAFVEKCNEAVMSS